MQTSIAKSTPVSVIPLKRITMDDLDYLAARIHARRSRIAEAERLDGLCRIRSLEEFFRIIFPESHMKGIVDFQRQLMNELINELFTVRACLTGPGADILDWMLVRFQAENVKVMIRAYLTKTPLEEIQDYLIPLPIEFSLNAQDLANAESFEDFVRFVPMKLLRESLEKTLEIYRENPQPFFFEGALDCAYCKGLIERAEHLFGEDRTCIRPMVYQEADIFNIMLVARGKFYYGLSPKELQLFYVPGTRISHAQFLAMMSDTDLLTSIYRVSDRVLDVDLSQFGLKEGSIDDGASVIERLAWNRFFRLSNLTFRKSHMGLAAIIGYMGLRRIEATNLIRISEGIRMEMPSEAIRGYMIPWTGREGKHV